MPTRLPPRAPPRRHLDRQRQRRLRPRQPLRIHRRIRRPPQPLRKAEPRHRRRPPPPRELLTAPVQQIRIRHRPALYTAPAPAYIPAADLYRSIPPPPATQPPPDPLGAGLPSGFSGLPSAGLVGARPGRDPSRHPVPSRHHSRASRVGDGGREGGCRGCVWSWVVRPRSCLFAWWSSGGVVVSRGRRSFSRACEVAYPFGTPMRSRVVHFCLFSQSTAQGKGRVMQAGQGYAEQWVLDTRAAARVSS